MGDTIKSLRAVVPFHIIDIDDPPFKIVDNKPKSKMVFVDFFNKKAFASDGTEYEQEYVEEILDILNKKDITAFVDHISPDAAKTADYGILQPSKLMKGMDKASKKAPEAQNGRS